jgi:hypothetical protein
MENDQGRTRMHGQRVGRGASSILRENGEELARGTLRDREHPHTGQLIPTHETYVERRKRIMERGRRRRGETVKVERVK